MAAHFLSPLTSDESIKTRKLKDPANNGREKVSWEDRKFAGKKKQKKQTLMTSSFLPTAFIWLIQYTFFFRRQITGGKSLFFSYYN